ncbi:PPE family protein [Mycolicibacillus trivialis]|uniref:PPE family protein n=1 Tax=Mycolicibacillus trivialis TaxID=1798 RepID=A0A1X2ERU3_9MYCO|nr:PPE family protein [Mycolicibacillus trivialis]ORX08508.1 hypothetical protein AWC30_02455 [Mycolicibacillus trivialis]
MEFALLPPEINSLRMYTGPGSGPMLAASAAWDGLAAELRSAATAYHSVIQELTATSWLGPSALAMAAAAAPQVAWLNGTATQAEQTAAQAKVAAGAYETAFAATVPPPVIAANRALLAALVATNILGQNTAAIAATEAHYAEMWAQDVAAMYGYSATAGAASQLEPFAPAPTTSDPGSALPQAGAQAATGTARAALSQAMTALPHTASAMQPLAAGPAAASPLDSLNSFITGPLSPLSMFPVAGVPFLLGIQSFLLPLNGQNLAEALARNQPPTAMFVAETPAAPTAAARPVLSAGMGNAGTVGKLSVPQNWATTAPAVKQVASVLQAAPAAAETEAAELGGANMLSPMGLSALAGRATANIGGATARTVTVGDGTNGTATATIIVLPADE